MDFLLTVAIGLKFGGWVAGTKWIRTISHLGVTHRGLRKGEAPAPTHITTMLHIKNTWANLAKTWYVGSLSPKCLACVKSEPLHTETFFRTLSKWIL